MIHQELDLKPYIVWAHNDNALLNLGLNPIDYTLVLTKPQNGYVKNTNIDIYHTITLKHKEALWQSIMNPKTGSAFAKELYETAMSDNKPPYWQDPFTTINELGISISTMTSPFFENLLKGFLMATKDLSKTFSKTHFCTAS